MAHVFVHLRHIIKTILNQSVYHVRILIMNVWSAQVSLTQP